MAAKCSCCDDGWPRFLYAGRYLHDLPEPAGSFVCDAAEDMGFNKGPAPWRQFNVVTSELPEWPKTDREYARIQHEEETNETARMHCPD